jgi:glycosyltransferase involved in cell wall biosynthesis
MKTLQVGSNSIHVSSYIQALSEFESDIYLLSEEICNFKGVKTAFLVDFRKLSPVSIKKNTKLLKNILLELKPDIIHIHQINRLAYFTTKIAQKLNIPCISTAWGSDVLLIPKQNTFFRHLVKKSLERSKIVTADALVMIDEMQLLAPSGSKYVHLQYGVNLVQKAEKENIIYSNRLHKKLYRIEQILYYFADFIQMYPDWKLVIAGEGQETARLKELASDLDLSSQVEFAGWLGQEENYKFYAKSKIYVSIPESDGTSVSVLEAMSAGCLPVVSDLAVSHEWIVNKVNGIIESTNINPFLEALNMEQSDFETMNLGLVKEKAGKRACTQQFIEIYKANVG